jgi:hypothetical protein
MEFVYISTSKSFPGMVKIGRTSRNVDKRMAELSEDDYGTSGFSGDSEWEAVQVIEVEDSVEAEALLHEHFNHLRVENGRELFYVDDPNDISSISLDLVDGKDAFDTFDTLDSLTAGLSILAGITGINELILNYKPNNKTNIDAADYLDKWDKRLIKKSNNSKSILAKSFYKTLNLSHKASRFVGKKGAKVLSSITKNTNLDYWAIDREDIPNWGYTEMYYEFLRSKNEEMENTKGNYKKVLALAKYEIKVRKLGDKDFWNIGEANPLKYPNYTNPYAHEEISVAYLGDAKLKDDRVGMYWQSIFDVGVDEKTGEYDFDLQDKLYQHYEIICNDWSAKFNKDFLKSHKQAVIASDFALLESLKRLAVSFYYGRGLSESNYQQCLTLIYLYTSGRIYANNKKLEDFDIYIYRKLIIQNISQEEFSLIDKQAAFNARSTLYRWQENNMINLFLPSGDSYEEAGIIEAVDNMANRNNIY